MDKQTLLLFSILGVIVFSLTAGFFYRYADGKVNVQEGDKREKYLQWQATHGAGLKKAIKAIYILFGVLMLFQVLSVLKGV